MRGDLSHHPARLCCFLSSDDSPCDPNHAAENASGEFYGERHRMISENSQEMTIGDINLRCGPQDETKFVHHTVYRALAAGVKTVRAGVQK
jgi:hypothetical protein